MKLTIDGYYRLGLHQMQQLRKVDKHSCIRKRSYKSNKPGFQPGFLFSHDCILTIKWCPIYY